MSISHINEAVAFISAATGWVSIKTQGYVEATLHPKGGVDGRRQGKPWTEDQLEEFLQAEVRLVREALYRGLPRSMLITDVDSGKELNVELSGSYTQGISFTIKEEV